MQSNLILAHILCTIFASVFLDLMLKEACSTVHPTFGRRIRPETKAVRHTFDAHIFDFSSLLLHGAHSPIDHLHACNGIVDSFRQKPKTVYLFSHTAENCHPISGQVRDLHICIKILGI